METSNSIQEIVFKYIYSLEFNEKDIDFAKLEGHKVTIELLSQLSNSSICIFDLYQKKMVYFSNNYGLLLGYDASEYEELNYHFFDSKIHPDDKHTMALYGLSSLKIFKELSKDEKLNHKVVYEFRMMNADNKYVRLIDQYQILELDKTGQVWLMMSNIDISPNQENESEVKCQIINFRTREFITREIEVKPQLELTKRELEILQLVKQGFLSKEIADKLTISVHTVNTHRQRFLEKLGAQNAIEAVIFASKYGLLS